MLIVDDELSAAKRARLELHVGRRFGDATLPRLTAPSPSATSGVRLGGAVEGDGTWRSPPKLERRPNRAGTIALDIAPASATLVTVAALPAPGALRPLG